MASDTEIATPPPGFELQANVPPPPPGFVLEKPAAEKSELNKMRGRLGMQETEESGESFPRKLYNLAGQRTGIGASAGGILGAALGPSTGGLSILVPALAAAAGGGLGAISEGKSPYKEGAKEGLLQGATGGLSRIAKPAWQYAKGSVMKTFGGRAGVSEAAEGLFKKWFTPQIRAETLYRQAEASGVHVPLSDTATVIDDVLRNEVNRMPTKHQKELKDLLEPIQQFVTPTVGRGRTQTRFLISQPVKDTMADIRRLSAAAKEAFGGKTPNTDLGNAINRVRAAQFDDLERVGVPEAREASKNFRRQMAIETLSEQISRPIPGVKLRDAYRKNALFDKSFTPAEKAQIDRIVRKLDTVTPSGLSGAFGKMITTGVGAVIGAPFGPIGHAVGSVAGYVGAEQIRELLASPAGRDFMERTLADSYRLGSGKVVQTLGPAWAIFARGLMSGTEDPQPEQ